MGWMKKMLDRRRRSRLFKELGKAVESERRERFENLDRNRDRLTTSWENFATERTRQFRARLQPGARVLCLDGSAAAFPDLRVHEFRPLPSGPMAPIAEALADANSPDAVKGRVVALPFETGEFDGVVATASELQLDPRGMWTDPWERVKRDAHGIRGLVANLEIDPKPWEGEKAFAEIRRVLADGGVFQCSVVRQVGWCGTAQVNTFGFDLSEQELRDLLTDAGFSIEASYASGVKRPDGDLGPYLPLPGFFTLARAA